MYASGPALKAVPQVEAQIKMITPKCYNPYITAIKHVKFK